LGHLHFSTGFPIWGWVFQGTKLLGAPTSSRSIHQQKIRLAYRGFGPPSILVIPISMDWFVGENLQETMVFTIKYMGFLEKISHHPIL
jgi:hypothetical protein